VPLAAVSGCSNDTRRRYSITSSAIANSPGDTVRPRALAVLRLIASSNLIGCSIGKAAPGVRTNGPQATLGESEQKAIIQELHVG
jgi:hypothetical protein